MLFLCLPTLFDDDIERFDMSSVNDVCKILHEKSYKGIVVLKSTVEPGTTSALCDTFGLTMIHNPEFLTARTAYYDFHHQKHIILGNPTEQSAEVINNLHKFYSRHYPMADITMCSSAESELTKLALNSFYAIKVQYFNEIYHLCEGLGCNYDKVKSHMLKQKWINPMHTNVPGHDGKFSFGGACLPKDIKALRKYSERTNSPCCVMAGCVTEHLNMRNSI